VGNAVLYGGYYRNSDLLSEVDINTSDTVTNWNQ
jgi:hypothetical protein